MRPPREGNCARTPGCSLRALPGKAGRRRVATLRAHAAPAVAVAPYAWSHTTPIRAPRQWRKRSDRPRARAAHASKERHPATRLHALRAGKSAVRRGKSAPSHDLYSPCHALPLPETHGAARPCAGADWDSSVAASPGIELGATRSPEPWLAKGLYGRWTGWRGMATSVRGRMN